MTGCMLGGLSYIGITINNYDMYIKYFAKETKKPVKVIDDSKKNNDFRKEIETFKKTLQDPVDLIILDMTTDRTYSYVNYLKQLWETMKKGILVVVNNRNRWEPNFLKSHYREQIFPTASNSRYSIYIKGQPTKPQSQSQQKGVKRYLILSKYFNNFRQFFPANWVPVDRYHRQIDFVYVDARFRKLKELYDVNSNYKSLGIFPKAMDIDNKSFLHNFVKQHNPDLFQRHILDQFDIVPTKNNDYKNQFKTYKLDDYKNQFKTYKYWILKPIPGGEGFGIKVVDNFPTMKKYITEFKGTWHHKPVEKWVMQHYMYNPLLINQRKFHIRMYYLVVKVAGKLSCYLFNHGMVYLAKKAFDMVSLGKDKISLDKDIHDTHGSSMDPNEKKLIFPHDFYKMFGYKKTNTVVEDITNIFKYISTIVKFDCYRESKNCFNFVGIDIMITDKFETKLIELNTTPGFRPLMWDKQLGNHFIGELLDILGLSKRATNTNTKVALKHYTRF